MSDSKKEYEAILIDTSVFDQNGLRLEKGLLKKLTQFKKSPIIFLFPDVIAKEIKSHLHDKIKTSRNALEKSLNDAEDHLFFEGDTLKEAKSKLLDTRSVDEVAESRLNEFISETGAEPLECGALLTVSNLLDQYFENKPPFAATGKKKNEFPDAIVLLAAEEWAKKENKNILAIAKDKDWEQYCDSSSRIDYEEDLAAGLAVFNETNAPYALLTTLEKSLDENQAISFLSKVEEYLSTELEHLTPDQDADSYLYWEPEGCHAWFKEFEFQGHDFRIVEVDEDYIVLEASALITVEAEGDFSLSVYDSIDKDQVNMGGVSTTAEETFESTILITMVGDLNGELSNLDIDEVEIVTPITSIHFGTIEPNYDQYE